MQYKLKFQLLQVRFFFKFWYSQKGETIANFSCAKDIIYQYIN